MSYVTDKLSQISASERARQVAWMMTDLYVDDEPPRPDQWDKKVVGPGVGRGWHDADPLPPPILMPDLCPTLKGSGLTLGDVSAAIYETHAMLKAAGPEYNGEDVRRAMILNRLEARLNEARAVRASS